MLLFLQLPYNKHSLVCEDRFLESRINFSTFAYYYIWYEKGITLFFTGNRCKFFN